MFFDPVAASSDIDPKWLEDAWAKCPNTILEDGNIRTGPVRLSFCHLYTPKALEAAKDPKYQASFLFPVGADLSLLKAEATKVAFAAWPNLGQPGAPTLATPFRDQVEKQQFEGYVPGSTFLACYGDNPPLRIDQRGSPIVDENKLYPGCWVLAIINPFDYGTGKKGGQTMKKGVSFGLNGVILIEDDRQVGGGGGVDVSAAIQGVNISGSINPAALFNGTGGAATPAVTAASLF